MMTLTIASLLLAFPLHSKQMPTSEQTQIPPTLENPLTEEAVESFDLPEKEDKTGIQEGLLDAFEPLNGDAFRRSSPQK